jgi:chemotaxis protein histidine kinase CheA
MTEADLLDEAITELYTADPESFTARRGALVAQAREAGDAAVAKKIAGLRKPTRSAWLINQLVRNDPSVPGRLAELGDELRTAQAALDGPKIRELSAARRRLIEDLARQAFQLAGQDAPPATMREDLTATFGAALADPAVTEQLAAGTLLRAAHRADFSPGGPGLTLVPPPGGRTAAAPATRAAPAAAPARRATPASKTAPPAAPRSITSARSARRAAADAEAAAREAAAAQAAASEEAARQAAERAAAERRQALAEAQQALADATQDVDQATAAEQTERDHVRELQQQLAEIRHQLADAQQRLADARARTRLAEGARHKARRAVERLQR